jgi:probable phosphoglycerate mutase
MPTLYFIRHGETDWNRAGRLQGHTDIELNPRGEGQAAAAAAHLNDVLATHPEAPAVGELPFFASPMRRTRQTVEILRGALGLDRAGYMADERLREIAFGAWEGKTWAEIRARDPIRARDRDADIWNFAPPGGESYADVLRRVSAWLEELTGDCCVIAHGGIARVLMVAVSRVRAAEAVRAEIWQGKILRLDEDRTHWLPGPGHH